MKRRSQSATLLLGLAVVGVLAACGGGLSPAPSLSPSSSPAVAPSSSPSPSSAGSSSAPATRSASPSPAAVGWDASLLAVLPADIDGRPLTPEPEAFAASASDPALVRDMEAGTVTLVTDTATGDYAVSFVYRLRPGVYDEGWYRSWRDSFDAGVCEQAGGVSGTAQAQLGGRTVDIGSCVGGVLTYHAHLSTSAGDLVVSSQSLGDERLGEQVMAGLRR